VAEVGGARGWIALLALICAWGCSGDAVAPGSPAKAKGGKGAAGAAKEGEASAAATATDAPAEPVEYSYDPTNKRDPFRSFVRGIYDKGDEAESSPLERFDLSQLELAAIIWGIDAPRALIVDPSGKGYIVATGAIVGKNKGRIISIGDNLVVVKETYIDSFDRATTKPVEMRLRNTQGG
jgi:type IV pilus assembly protein PilP